MILTGSSRKPIPKPKGFSWDAPIYIYRDKNGSIKTTFDVSKYQWVGAGKTYYVKLSGGADTNDGLTPATAFRSVWKALEQVDVDIVLVDAGYYEDTTGFNNTSITRNVSIKALPGADVTISTKRTLAWTKTGGYTNVYQATRSLVAKVYDAAARDRNEDYTEMVSKASIAEVDATPGSYYFEIGPNTLYVHTANSRAADNSVYVFLDEYNLQHIGDKTIYVEGIKFEGGKYAADIKNTAVALYPKFYAKNCTFKYSSAGNALNVLGPEYIFLQNCEAARALDDGFNYHIQNGVVTRVIEVNCTGRDNGKTSDTDNGSTIHDGGNIVRVNGKYFRNLGPNVADVSTGTESWNVGCIAFGSIATATGQNVDFFMSDSGGGSIKAWLDSCVGFDSRHSLKIDNVGTQCYVRNTDFKTETLVGTKTAY